MLAHLLKTNILISLSDERILEYDIDKVLFDKRSPFQKVQIVHSKSLGNMLVLDELQSTFDYKKIIKIHFNKKTSQI